MNNQTSILIDADLDAVSGGVPLSCDNAVSIAKMDLTISNLFSAYGDAADAGKWSEKASMVLHNACGTGRPG